MSLSSELRAALESMGAALEACEAILNPAPTEEEEIQAQLEEHAAWAD